MIDELQKYIPKSKHDTGLIAGLSKHEYPYYKPILKDLFEWVQDINWPVAREIVPLLAKAGTDVIPDVRDILDSKDAVWIYWVLTIILNNFSYSDGKAIVTELKFRLIHKLENPTEDENAEGIDEIINDLFNKFNVTMNEG